jgi:hypothetical protein
MSLDRQYSFFGQKSVLSTLTYAGVLVMGSGRLSWAITIAGSFFWVYGLTSFTFALLLSTIGIKITPARGRSALYVCLASFWGSLYLLFFWLLCPLAALEIFFVLLIIPLYFTISGIFDQIPSSENNFNIDVFELVSDSLSQASVISGLLIAFSILREPLSYCSLTFPGSYQGMVTIMYFNANSFFPIGIFVSSSGALLLLAYIISLYQYSKNFIYPGEKV